jgi:dephospho-CoA kinase
MYFSKNCNFSVLKTIGITGGIGSGKTTVCKILELLQVPVFYADIQARTITDSSDSVIVAIKQLFGVDIYNVNGLDRGRLASLVFNNPQLLQQLNGIVHPAVDQAFERWKASFLHLPFVVKEAAILFETGKYLSMDELITVTAPVELRIKRVIKRDKLSREQVIKRMENQWPDEKKIALSHHVITCDEQQLVIPQVLNLYHQLMNY